MFGRITFAVLLSKVLLASSARVTSDAKLSTGARTSLSSDGELRAKTKNSDCDLSRYKELKDRFEDLTYAVSGANGCVVLAEDKKNSYLEVAVKLSKRAGKLKSWQDECEQSRSLHQKACAAGHEQLLLAERYLPICLEVGGTNDAPFMVMHAAGGKGIGAMRSKLRGEERLSVFAQMVGALTAMHGIGVSHNDLHNNNVVLSKPGPLVAFIDFGEVQPLKYAVYRGGYKHDENLLPREAAQLAGCPAEAHYPFNSGIERAATRDQRKKALMECLEEKWGKGEDKTSFGEFKKALGEVVDEAYDHEHKENKHDITTTRVAKLYHTTFVQKHQPALQSLFPAHLCKKKKQGTSSDSEELDHLQQPSLRVTTEDSIPLTTTDEPATVPSLPSKHLTTPEQQDNGDCKTFCHNCPKKSPMYVCLAGTASRGCSKKPWSNRNSCTSSCTCME